MAYTDDYATAKAAQQSAARQIAAKATAAQNKFSATQPELAAFLGLMATYFTAVTAELDARVAEATAAAALAATQTQGGT